MVNEKIKDGIQFEYHNMAFFYLHQELEKLHKDVMYHPIRNEFWGIVPEGLYDPIDGGKLVEDYLEILEHEIKKIISKNSIAYWIHLLRRISCVLEKFEGDGERSGVVGLVRCIFEASIQKYGKIESCNRVGSSGELEVEDILDGFFVKNGLIEFGEEIIKNSQLVLTKFGLNELKEFYLLEKLIFEFWRSAANLRGLNKGASWLVTHNPGDAFEERDEILQKSIKIFDDRFAVDIEAQFTAKGTLHEVIGKDDRFFIGHLPIYNIIRINTKSLLEDYFKMFTDYNIIIKNEIITNFIALPINLLNYYNSNSSYSAEFQRVNNINFESVIIILSSLLDMVVTNWDKPDNIMKFWQRGYEGPYLKESILKTLKTYVPVSCKIFDFKEEIIDFEKGIDFWTLNVQKRANMDLSYPGPHSIFLPYGPDRIFIDYAWINRRLFDLFWNCELDDEKFKGNALESFIQSQNKVVLPTTPCIGIDGEKKQIDASFEKDGTLIIIECKANNLSIGFDRGNKEAIAFREKKYNNAIIQVDETARWLLKHRKGTNFDIHKYNKIIPIVVTPFKEYIRTDNRKYWISDEIPRILTPSELIDFLNKDEFWNTEENVLFIDKQ